MSDLSMRPPPLAWMESEDRDNPLVVPELDQDEAFALFDDFYGASPLRPATPPPFGDNEFADMMGNLNELEMQLPSSDLPMQSDHMSLPSTSLFHEEPSAISPAFVTAPDLLEDQHVQNPSLPDLPMPDASPSSHSGNAYDSEPPAASPALASDVGNSQEQQHHQLFSHPDLLFQDTSSLTQSGNNFDSEPPIASTALVTKMDVSEYQNQNAPPASPPDLPTHNASPLDHSPKMLHGKPPSTSPALVREPTVPGEQHLEHPSLSDLPMPDASPMEHSPKALDEEPSSTSPVIASESRVFEEHYHHHPQTPALPLTQHMIDAVRGSSLAPSTGGHRSSMQGEMRQEEDELSTAPLKSLPPFPGFRADGDYMLGSAIDTPLAEGHRKEAYDLSDSRDIGERRVDAFAKPSPQQEMPNTLPPFETAPAAMAEAMLSPVASTNILKRGRQPSSPTLAPPKRPRLLPWVAPSQQPEALTPKKQKVPMQEVPMQARSKLAKAPRIEESDSSLTDISLSLSAIIATSPEQTDDQAVAPLGTTSRTFKPERKDSTSPTSVRRVKKEAQAPSSLAKNEVVPEHKSTKGKGKAKFKSNEIPAASASPAPVKASKAAKKTDNNTPAVSASPAPARLTKSTKVTKTTGKETKASKPAIKNNDLRGIISAGVLSDVLKQKGPRQTRGQQKAVEKAKPDPALAAKSRHTGHVNYKD